MSAIWGAVCHQFTIDQTLISKTSESMSKYRIDKIDTCYDKNYFFSCGHQAITSLSMADVSPIETEGHIFLGDCFLYNRDAIIEEILSSEISSTTESYEHLATLGDNNIAYLLYLIKGDSFVKSLRGSFAFVIYDRVKNLLNLFSDQYLNRYLIYSIDATTGCVYFSSTTDPIKVFWGENLKINRKFILHAYKHPSPSFFNETTETQYEDVFFVNPATQISINLVTGSLKKICYWKPQKIKTLKHNKPLAYYKECFVKNYEQVIHSMLRSSQETGIMLSGGLDSVSITAFAAPYLEKKGQSLLSYTQVPCPEYPSQINSYVVENESVTIKHLQKFFPNLQCTFLDEGNSNCFERMKEFSNIYDVPNKAFANMPHLVNILQKASSDGCKIVLNGGNGNATVSYGIFSEVLTADLKHFRFFKFVKDVNETCAEFDISRKSYLKRYLSGVKESFTKVEELPSPFYPTDIAKYSLKHPNKDYKRIYGTGNFQSNKHVLAFRHDRARFVQMGMFNTYWSLLFGVMILDPTQCVEMTELCLSLPYKCYQQNGVCRYTIRGFLKDYLPPEILNPHIGRGRQAADFEFCLNRDWDNIKDELIKLLRDPQIYDYIREDYLESLICEAENSVDELSRGLLWRLLTYASLTLFLSSNRI